MKSSGTTENNCERFFWALSDANYNVLGLVSSTGRLVERYEYTPYGKREVYSHGWVMGDVDDDGDADAADEDLIEAALTTNDPDSRCDINGNGTISGGDLADFSSYYSGTAALSDVDPLVLYPRSNSFRTGYFVGVSGEPLCEVGHQGLMHDEEFGLIYNRARYLHPTLGRFVQRDPLGYVDGMNEYIYLRNSPITHHDWDGMRSSSTPAGTGATVGCCGPQVKNEVAAALAKVRRKFAAASSAQRDIICDELFGLGGLQNNDAWRPGAPAPVVGSIPGLGGDLWNNAWDILPLFRGNVGWINSPPISPPCATPTTSCGSTVQVSNQCFYAGSVNYVLFGQLGRLCNKKWGAIAERIRLYKGGFVPGTTPAGNFQSSMDWAKAGFAGWPAGVATPPGDRSGCATGCKASVSSNWPVYVGTWGQF